jgi:hypothetical protein
MARIKMSALISDIRGKLSDQVYSFCHCTHYVKDYQPVVANPRTYKQVFNRDSFGKLSKSWDDLSTISKSLWNSFAVMHRKTMSGYNAFIMLNQNLCAASHSDLVCVTYPPKFPATPRFPFGFCVTPISSTVNCITWTTPALITNYITARFRLHKMFCCVFPSYSLCPTVGFRPTFRFVQTVRSDVSQIIHTHTWPSGARLYYKLRSIDTFGRITPYTHELRIIVP